MTLRVVLLLVARQALPCVGDLKEGAADLLVRCEVRLRPGLLAAVPVFLRDVMD
jgi:hypothetical protein